MSYQFFLCFFFPLVCIRMRNSEKNKKLKNKEGWQWSPAFWLLGEHIPNILVHSPIFTWKLTMLVSTGISYYFRFHVKLRYPWEKVFPCIFHVWMGLFCGKVMQLQQVFISELFWYPAASLGGESLSFVAFLSWTWGMIPRNHVTLLKFNNSPLEKWMVGRRSSPLGFR